MKTENAGFTIVELMVAVLVSSLLAIAAVTVFAKQSVFFTGQAKRGQAGMVGLTTLNILGRLLREAEKGSVSITSAAGSTTVDFVLPPGFSIWPNTTAPYLNNSIRVSWTNAGNQANQLLVRNAASSAALPAAAPISLAGSSTNLNVIITDFQVTPDPVTAEMYRLTLKTASGMGAGGKDGETSFETYVALRN